MMDTMDICPICNTPFPVGRMEEWCLSCLMTSAASVSSIPGITVIEEIARGGMAIVSKAQQADPKRAVAIKTLQAQWAGNAILCERFRREADVMAALEHPGILPIYEVGEWEGLPWFTMKLADQGSLATQVAAYSGKWKEIAQLIAKIAEALSFAHERGVLHRDVKPGNILFDADRAPYLADFGLAKQLEAVVDQEVLTMEASVLGTPSFIAPELAAGTAREATTSSDIYSLAVVLYELLAGRPPYTEEHLPSLLQRIANETPTSLTNINPEPPRDLRLICEKAMSREPQRRYVSAREMGDDLQRFIQGIPVFARQVGSLERLWFWCRRHPAIAALLAFSVSLMSAWGISISAAWVQIKKSNAKEIEAREAAEVNLLESKLAEAEGIRLSRKLNFRDRVLGLVKEVGRANESSEMRFNRRSEAVAVLAFPKMELKTVELKSLDLDNSTTQNAEYSSISEISNLPIRIELPIQAEAMSPDKRWLAVTENNGTTHIWDSRKKRTLNVPSTYIHNASDLVFSPDSNYILTISLFQRLTIFDLVSGTPVARLDVRPAELNESITWENEKIRFVSYEAEICEIGITAGAYSSSLVPIFTNFTGDFCLSPDGNCLFVGNFTEELQWNLQSSVKFTRAKELCSWAGIFSKDGRFFYSLNYEGLYRSDVKNNFISENSEQLLPHFEKSISSLSIVHEFVAVAAWNGPSRGVELWNFETKTKLLDQKESAFSIALSSDAKFLAIGRDQYEVWECSTGKKVLELPSRPINVLDSYCTFSPDGRWLLTGHDSGRMCLWRVRDWQKLCTLESPSQEAVGHFVFSEDSSKISSVSRSGLVEVWDLKQLSEELDKIGLGLDH